MKPFVYTTLPARVIFGFGTLDRVQAEVSALGCTSALILSTPQQQHDAVALSARLGSAAVGIFADATMHTPVEVTQRALEVVSDVKADCVVALGGGSTIGLGKAIALRTDLPQIVIPTTYAGSEATPILGETQNARKVTQRSSKVLLEVILYDVDLTLGLPVGMSVTSGMNAVAHAVEALYAQDENPLISALAEQGIAALAHALPRIVENPTDREARSDALYGAWACGTCLGSVGMALHHKLCHVLGGSFNLPHADTHTVVLPHVIAYNAEAAPTAISRIIRALGKDDAAQGVFDLASALSAPTSLRDIGMRESGLDEAADQVVASPYWNPRPINRDAIRAVLQCAFEGKRPGTKSYSATLAENYHA